MSRDAGPRSRPVRIEDAITAQADALLVLVLQLNSFIILEAADGGHHVCSRAQLS